MLFFRMLINDILTYLTVCLSGISTEVIFDQPLPFHCELLHLSICHLSTNLSAFLFLPIPDYYYFYSCPWLSFSQSSINCLIDWMRVSVPDFTLGSDRVRGTRRGSLIAARMTWVYYGFCLFSFSHLWHAQSWIAITLTGEK